MKHYQETYGVMGEFNAQKALINVLALPEVVVSLKVVEDNKGLFTVLENSHYMKSQKKPINDADKVVNLKSAVEAEAGVLTWNNDKLTATRKEFARLHDLKDGAAPKKEATVDDIKSKVVDKLEKLHEFNAELEGALFKYEDKLNRYKEDVAKKPFLVQVMLNRKAARDVTKTTLLEIGNHLTQVEPGAATLEVFHSGKVRHLPPTLNSYKNIAEMQGEDLKKLKDKFRNPENHNQAELKKLL